VGLKQNLDSSHGCPGLSCSCGYVFRFLLGL
jgi:hypothetical protein